MASTAVLYETKSIIWRIPDFEQLRESMQLLSEQHFKFTMSLGANLDGEIPSLTWDCRLRPSPGVDIGVFLYLPKVPQELSKCHATLQFQVTDHEKKTYYKDATYSVCMSQYIKGPRKGYGCKNLVPRWSPESPFLTEDGELEIRLTITIFDPETHNVKPGQLEARYKDLFTRQFRNHLGELRSTPLDISNRHTEIVAKDGVSFPVSPVILAARSPVFRVIFQSDHKAVLRAKWRNMESKPLEVLLHFLHTGELSENWKAEDVLEGLVYGTHICMVKDLQGFLEQVIGLVCTNQNCGRLMGVSKAVGWKKAQEQLLDYFKKNMLQNVEEILRFAMDTAAAEDMIRSFEDSENQKGFEINVNSGNEQDSMDKQISGDEKISEDEQNSTDEISDDEQYPGYEEAASHHYESGTETTSEDEDVAPLPKKIRMN